MFHVKTSSTFTFLDGDRIAAGSIAGALDDNFDSTSQLTIYNVKDQSVLQTYQVHSKFNTLDYSPFKGGVIVAGLESGEVQLYVPSKPEPVFTKQAAQGPMRGLHTNKKQPNLFATASRGDDLNIWDISNLASPYTPGNRTPKLANVDISCLKWNNGVPHILASSAYNGYTVIWDLKNKREVISIPPSSATPAICEWHPSIPTSIITTNSTHILQYDLRNAQQPVFSIPHPDTLSLSWNPLDPSLLISSNQQSLTTLWNIESQSILHQSTTDKWTFKTAFHPSNPSLYGASSYSTLSIDSIEDHCIPSYYKVPFAFTFSLVGDLLTKNHSLSLNQFNHPSDPSEFINTHLDLHPLFHTIAAFNQRQTLVDFLSTTTDTTLPSNSNHPIAISDSIIDPLAAGQFNLAISNAIHSNDWSLALIIASLSSNDLFNSVKQLYLNSSSVTTGSTIFNHILNHDYSNSNCTPLQQLLTVLTFGTIEDINTVASHLLQSNTTLDHNMLLILSNQPPLLANLEPYTQLCLLYPLLHFIKIEQSEIIRIIELNVQHTQLCCMIIEFMQMEMPPLLNDALHLNSEIEVDVDSSIQIEPVIDQFKQQSIQPTQNNVNEAFGYQPQPPQPQYQAPTYYQQPAPVQQYGYQPTSVAPTIPQPQPPQPNYQQPQYQQPQPNLPQVPMQQQYQPQYQQPQPSYQSNPVQQQWNDAPMVLPIPRRKSVKAVVAVKSPVQPEEEKPLKELSTLINRILVYTNGLNVLPPQKRMVLDVQKRVKAITVDMEGITKINGLMQLLEQKRIEEAKQMYTEMVQVYSGLPWMTGLKLMIGLSK